MKERPILFSAPMVRAILEGRKTQTRRIIDHQPDAEGLWPRGTAPGAGDCRHGKPGDRLWVRETWAGLGVKNSAPIVYRADAPGGERVRVDAPWRPSIFMPRNASRITLDITEVRVERLNDISPEDAEAEGLACVTKDGSMYKYGIPDNDGLPGTDDHGWPWHLWRQSPVDAYEWLWESINGTGSWAENPWIWAITFNRFTS